MWGSSFQWRKRPRAIGPCAALTAGRLAAAVAAVRGAARLIFTFGHDRSSRSDAEARVPLHLAENVSGLARQEFR